MDFSYQFYRATDQAWDAMHQAILEARQSIYWELYMFSDDAEGERFVEALCVKAGQGVDVKIILDSFGSRALSRNAESRLRLSGARLLWYNHLWPDWKMGEWLRRLWVRNHRKVLIIDEKMIFTGGVNVSAEARAWYDLHLRVANAEAPALLRSFAKSYIRCGGHARDVSPLLKLRRRQETGERQKINYIIHSPSHSARHPFLLRRFYWRALRTARETFNLVTPYYVPDARFLQLAARACRRGVKVNIILPWRPDHKFMQYIADAFYDLTQRLGVNLYFLRRMNHAKGFSVDNTLGMVGSINLTPRSFFTNQEIGAYFDDAGMVRDLNGIFDSWKAEALPLSEIGGQRYGWRSRFKKWWGEKLRDWV